MALVKYGGGILDMRGSIGGQVHSRNSSGNYIRARTKPVNPNTDRQITIRSALAFLSNRWAQDLTAPQRTAWNLYAANVNMKNKLGETITISGYNHYLRSNVIRKQVALAIIDDGPVIFELPAQDPTFAITATEAAQTISATYDDTMDWADETGSFMIGYQGRPQNAQRNFFAGPWRAYMVVSGVDAAPPASPSVTAVNYAIAELQHQWVYARILRLDGRLSEPFTADTFCAA